MSRRRKNGQKITVMAGGAETPNDEPVGRAVDPAASTETGFPVVCPTVAEYLRWNPANVAALQV